MKKNNRRTFLKKLSIGFLSFSLPDFTRLITWTKRDVLDFHSKKEIFFTTGFKVVEVTPNSAIIWTRLCSQKGPNPISHERREKVFRHPIDFDEDQPVEKMDGAVAGTSGFVRVKLFNSNEELLSEWLEVRPEDDFTVKVPFDNLQEGKEYNVEIEGRSDLSGKSNFTTGAFKTASDKEKVMPIHFATSTCQYFWSFDDKERGFKSYDSMRKLRPDFYIQTGDYVYYDKPGPLAKTIEEARHKWHAMDSWLSLRDLYKEVPIYMMKDDHDLLKNDVFPGAGAYGDISFNDGLKLWYENVPLPDKPYRTIRRGKDLQIWLMEGREYRSANSRPDSSEKTIWGQEQINWLKKTMEASDATFKILFSATPVVGPDRKNKSDNHANRAFQSEGEWLRTYLSKQNRVFVINGDRHWQYVSKDEETGLIEFGSGPVSNYHAQGWDPGDVRPEHKFLRVKGGFLGINVDRDGETPFIRFRHYDVNGAVVNEEKFE